MKYKEGQQVSVLAAGSFGDDGIGTIKKIVTYYHKLTGKPYKVVILEDEHEFDYEKGHALTSPTAYYITTRGK